VYSVVCVTVYSVVYVTVYSVVCVTVYSVVYVTVYSVVPSLSDYTNWLLSHSWLYILNVSGLTNGYSRMWNMQQKFTN